MAIEFCDGNGFAGIDHLHTEQLVSPKRAHRGTRAAGCGGGSSQISQVFSQQLRRQPRAPLGSDLFDEKELRPETLRPHRCRLLGFGLPQVWSADVRHLRVATAVSSRLGLGSGVCPSRTPGGAEPAPRRRLVFSSAPPLWPKRAGVAQIRKASSIKRVLGIDFSPL